MIPARISFHATKKASSRILTNAQNPPNGDGGLTQDVFEYGSGGVYDIDSYGCNGRTYLKQSNTCSKAPAAGNLEKARGMIVVQVVEGIMKESKWIAMANGGVGSVRVDMVSALLQWIANNVAICRFC